MKLLPLLPLLLVMTTVLVSGCNDVSQSEKRLVIKDSLQVGFIWPAHPVGFAMITESPHQYIAYYDSNRVMTVAHRELGSDNWEKRRLNEKIGWDTHNYIAMALDSKGYLHISGNMHVDTLVYFQSADPYDIQSLERVHALTGEQEDRVTYPEFFEGPRGDLIFTYRDGGSGRGNQIYNRYDPGTGKWKRLIDEPLVDGQGEMNAYLHGPVLGPDDYYHLIWVWRDTPDAATNHDISYAKSRDLVHWQKSDGSDQPLPITIDNGEIIDAVPAGGGMLNGNTVIGFDHQDRPVVTYHKFDAEGRTQVYNARREENGWQIYQATGWDFRWDFGGRGSINNRVGVYPVQPEGDQLVQRFWIDTVGVQRYALDKSDLKAVEQLRADHTYPAYLDGVRADHPEMRVNMVTDKIDGEEYYLLRWESLNRNRDRPREAPVPAARPLELYHVVKE
ncbi:BNR repeat-containing family member [Fodinibius roseus]|uniref:BNR repeat-containing family member n=1 Tax=Fodinibius roseus TaxID=1194090 RepID=A0A1M5DRR2_9BACT|nr:BNR repeat-containing protein [Fodinibius roseus]SHF69541.1 BNR repeat-containing family member [Fodinibius roseus]